MITLTGVSKSYFGQPRVLDHVNLDLKKGDFIYVVGGSGAGKTSLLRLLATEELPTDGLVSLFGYNLSKINPSTLRAIRQALGYIPQNVRLIPDLTVYENIEMSARLAGSRGQKSVPVRARIQELLDRVGLGPKRDTLASMLSGGEAQRVAVVRALVRSPELIVADEPTGAQDKEHTWALMDLFLKANIGGTTVVIATHDREIVRRVRKRCAVLKSGGLALEDGICIY